jgi:diadenylate cyclase
LAIAYFISHWQGFVTFNWILELFFSNLFLIVVILFQGEIRRALAQIGSNPLLIGYSSNETRYNLDEVAQGAMQLASRGIGALIVIEREIVLDYFVEPGTEMDAAISAEIINATFASTSPLHDGAMIIRNGRIFSAGNFLPLSKSPVLDKGRGTRHRAALGLAEQTDALVLVVSEETRSVNLFYGEIMKSDLDLATLRAFLYEEMGIPGRADKMVSA